MSHIIGKVYDLTQENFNKVIAELEGLQSDMKLKDHYIQTLHIENVNLKTKLRSLAVQSDIMIDVLKTELKNRGVQ